MPSRIRVPWQGYGRDAFTATWSGGSETIILYEGLYDPAAVAASINAMSAGPYTFVISTVANTTQITTTGAVTFDFADADLAAYLGFGTASFVATTSLYNPLPAEHSVTLSECPGDLRYQRRFVGPAASAIPGTFGRPTWGYHDTIQFSVWATSAEVVTGVGALRRLVRQGGYYLFDGSTTDPWHLEKLNGMARIYHREPSLALAELVAPEADTLRVLAFDVLVEGISP